MNKPLSPQKAQGYAGMLLQAIVPLAVHEKDTHKPHLMRKPLTHTQCIILALFWAALCFLVLTSAPRIDGMLIVTILISGALVFIPIIKAIKKGNKG